MTLTELSNQVGDSPVNLSVLKNDRAKAIRFSTLTAVCDVLFCQVGDLLVTTRFKKYPKGNRRHCQLMSCWPHEEAVRRAEPGPRFRSSRLRDTRGVPGDRLE